MRHIDEFNITQAVIAHHANAGNARLRELMTSLVQHLHAFVREVRLSEAECREGIRFLAECGPAGSNGQQELSLLSDTLGLSMLVTALNQRKPEGCTEATLSGPFLVDGAPQVAHGEELAPGAKGEPCYVRGRVHALDGSPIAGALVQVCQPDADGLYDAAAGTPHAQGVRGTLTSAADGSFHFKSILAEPHPIPHDGPVGRMLHALGRQPWRPAHLHFMIAAPGFEQLVTHVFRAGDRYLDSDAVFAVRRSLVTDWVHHAPGRTPDGQTSAVPFTTLDFDFVLNATPGDKT